jgi:hypothetical protein
MRRRKPVGRQSGVLSFMHPVDLPAVRTRRRARGIRACGPAARSRHSARPAEVTGPQHASPAGQRSRPGAARCTILLPCTPMATHAAVHTHASRPRRNNATSHHTTPRHTISRHVTPLHHTISNGHTCGPGEGSTSKAPCAVTPIRPLVAQPTTWVPCRPRQRAVLLSLRTRAGTLPVGVMRHARKRCGVRVRLVRAGSAQVRSLLRMSRRGQPTWGSRGRIASSTAVPRPPLTYANNRMYDLL